VATTIIWSMPQSARQKRICRAEELAAQHPAAAEILHFLAQVVRFQDEVQAQLETVLKEGERRISFAEPIAPELARAFPRFLAMVEEEGPVPLADEARVQRNSGNDSNRSLLEAFWARTETDASLTAQQQFLARAFLQPYAEFVRGRSGKQLTEWTPRLCPFCLRKPSSGVLRPLGDGGQRLLVCSFCLGEWEFRRIVCPSCGEESESKLPVFRAEDLDHIRVECCDSCRCYIKTVDLTRNGLADPVVDEIAAIPFDLWAQQQGYAKLQTNLMML
jgi:FdhE protein